MFNYKMIVAAAVVGFLLSFVTGLFSGVGFGLVLLRAIIFAIVLGLLASGIMFIFERFLDMDTLETSSLPKEVDIGGMVDISVGDDELTEEDSAPGFYVDAKVTNGSEGNSTDSVVNTVSSQLTNSNVSSENKVFSENTGNSQVDSATDTEKPVTENTQHSVQTNGFVKSDIQTMTSPISYGNYAENSSEDELDELPEFNSDNKGNSKTEGLFHKDSPIMENGVQDAEVMAQAIRTILNKDG